MKKEVISQIVNKYPNVKISDGHDYKILVSLEEELKVNTKKY